MPKCPSCGCEVEEEDRFCIQCGTPIPQEKKCPSCKIALPLNARFCFGCGMNLSGDSTKSSTGISMGDKNVIAGDVIGRKEDYQIAGNATIIKNEDETKKVMTCHHCGRNVPIIDGFSCQMCGHFVCVTCFDASKGVCVDCSENAKNAQESEYRDKLSQILSTGRITMEDRRTLQNLQSKLGLSDEVCSSIEADLKRNDATEDTLTRFEHLNLIAATNAFYQDGNVAKALSLVEPIYNKHPYDESVLAIFLPILAETDASKTLALINSYESDYLAAYLSIVDISLLTKDWATAETKIAQLKRMWPNQAEVAYRELVYTWAVYKKTGSSQFGMALEAMLDAFPTPLNKIQRTLWLKARQLVLAENLSDAECAEKDIYLALYKKNPLKKTEDEIKASVKMVLVDGASAMRSFYMATTEVTQGLYESIMGNNPSAFKSANAPVDNVSWFEACIFCNKLSERDGLSPCYTINGSANTNAWGAVPENANDVWNAIKCDFKADGYRLPMDAEWDFAAKCGKPESDFIYSDSNYLDEIGWYNANSEGTTHEVAAKKPNSLGLYDMNGNVWEMCWNIFDPESRSRVRRGGSWMNNAEACAISNKSGCLPFRRFNINGFRVCKSKN